MQDTKRKTNINEQELQYGMRFIENFSQNIEFVKYISVLRLLRRKQNTVTIYSFNGY